MKKNTLLLAAVSGLLALGLGWWLWTKKNSTASNEHKKISVLLRGNLHDSEALQRILKTYVSRHQPLEFEIFHQPMASHQMPEVPFSMVWADAETLVALSPKLRRFDTSEFQEGLSLDSILGKSDKSLGLPLYEHRSMVLYYDRSKVSARFSTWLDLGLALMPRTDRLKHEYGLAFGEDAEHALPFFSNLDPEGYTQLSLLRHALPIMPLDCPAPCADAIFKAGKAAMALAPDTQLDAFAQSLGSDRLGIMPLPSGKAPRQTQYLGLSADVKEIDRQAAEDFARYLSSPEGQKEIFRELRSIPSLTLQGQGKLEDRLADELLDYLRGSSTAVIESVREATLARLEPSLKPYLNGQTGETQAALALSHTEKGDPIHE